MRSDLITLPLTALSILRSGGLWNITKIGWGKTNQNHEILDDGTLKVFYPSGSYTPSQYPQGGIGIYTSPMNLFPSDEVILNYQVKFDETFQPVLGGKLPGLFLSEGVGKEYMRDASGGKYSDLTASCRIVWRKNFEAEAYVYLPENQSKEYYSIANFVENNAFGDSLWRGLFKFDKDDWNSVSLHIKVNSFDNKGNPNNDGILTLSINNETQRFNKLIWRVNPTTQVTAILFATFFGGGSPKYATPVNTWSYFRNVQIQTKGLNKEDIKEDIKEDNKETEKPLYFYRDKIVENIAERDTNC